MGPRFGELRQEDYVRRGVRRYVQSGGRKEFATIATSGMTYQPAAHSLRGYSRAVLSCDSGTCLKIAWRE